MTISLSLDKVRMDDVWKYSPNHGQICQVIESQTLWGDTTCRVWLSGRDSVVCVSATKLASLDDAGTETADGFAYVASTVRFERKAQVYPEMVPLLVIRAEGGANE